MDIENKIVTSIKINKKYPNLIQLANIHFEEKTGKKRTAYSFIEEAIASKLRKEGIIK